MADGVKARPAAAARGGERGERGVTVAETAAGAGAGSEAAEAVIAAVNDWLAAGAVPESGAYPGGAPGYERRREAAAAVVAAAEALAGRPPPARPSTLLGYHIVESTLAWERAATACDLAGEEQRAAIGAGDGDAAAAAGRTFLRARRLRDDEARRVRRKAGALGGEGAETELERLARHYGGSAAGDGGREAGDALLAHARASYSPLAAPANGTGS